MVTLIRNWSTSGGNTSLNNVPAQTTLDIQAKAVLRAFKVNYTSAGWSVEGSSDSVAGAMDATDRWDSDTDLVWAAGGVAHSWIVLKSPTNYPATGKNVWVLLACSTGASNQHLINAGWASAAYTSGSATADPTAPTNNRAFTNKQFLRTPVVNSKYHTMRSSVGDVLNFSSTDGTGYAMHVNAALMTGNMESGDNYPFLGMMAFTDSGMGSFIVTNTASSTQAVVFWHSDGTVINNASHGIINMRVSATDVPNSFTSAGSNISGKFFQIPAILGTTQTSKVALHGNLVDIYQAPAGSGVNQGTVEPSTGSSTTAIFGDFWVPNGNVVPSF